MTIEIFVIIRAVGFVVGLLLFLGLLLLDARREGRWGRKAYQPTPAREQTRRDRRR